MMRRARAFTLIELLVVIAVVGVLIGLTLPALGRARASARALASVAMHRSAAQAVMAYAGDWQDTPPAMPVMRDVPAGVAVQVPSEGVMTIWAMPAPGGIAYRITQYEGQGFWVSEILVANSYVSDRAIEGPGWRDEVGSPDQELVWPNQPNALWLTQAFLFEPRVFTAAGDARPTGATWAAASAQRLPNIRFPSEKVMLFESFVSATRGSPWHGAARLDGTRWAAAFVDGSAALVLADLAAEEVRNELTGSFKHSPLMTVAGVHGTDGVLR